MLLKGTHNGFKATDNQLCTRKVFLAYPYMHHNVENLSLQPYFAVDIINLIHT